jgi:hypothetical protein
MAKDHTDSTPQTLGQHAADGRAVSTHDTPFESQPQSRGVSLYYDDAQASTKGDVNAPAISTSASASKDDPIVERKLPKRASEDDLRRRDSLVDDSNVHVFSVAQPQDRVCWMEGSTKWESEW